MQRTERPIRIIGAACGRGSPDIRCGEGPDALRDAGLLERLTRLNPGVRWDETLRCEAPGLTPLEAVAELCPRLAQTTSDTINEGALPLVLTGDHSCAVGTWAGISTSLAPKGRLGLVWVDAHLDAHTPDTSHTGAIHGMPLAALLGYGEDQLTECGGPGAKILPSGLCIVGARSYESEELQFLNQVGVRIFFMDEVVRRGIDAVMRDALELVRAGTAGYGLSIDLDAIDPREAPGVGTPAARGIGASELAAALRGIGNDPDLAGIEISEYNPARDRDSRTARIAIELLEAMFGQPLTAQAREYTAQSASP
jgi:arginase